jgi:hypothetical protein
MLSNFSKSLAAVVFATSAVTGVTHAEPQSPQKMNSISKRACSIVQGTLT